MTRLVLASASPARKALLEAAGIRPEVIVSNVDESVVESADPAALSGTLARMKAEAVAAGQTGTGLVLGCDSVLAFEGEILGKPSSADDATRRWKKMRGSHGVLHTGHCLIDLASGKQVAATSATTVHWADITDAELDAYVASGEPLHVAGAFTIDGRGAPFVSRIEGDHGTVVGLSLPLFRSLLAEMGVGIPDLWAQ
ncbi:Maf family protein [Virgisporangium ochraceum]|uniref:Nucleoside triphosphate pyrophosphatase n=1 Tax=Virgisporangium ochraceum TaxID=65505 RepID=A0A8J3ZXH1_9ACTN|nr:nucleoside triphosphate pyrophosphatase [Virgisporangium ochraceum]GIJ70290.1 Maf-like protein [Virgisporangium ochraceum]